MFVEMRERSMHDFFEFLVVEHACTSPGRTPLEPLYVGEFQMRSVASALRPQHVRLAIVQAKRRMA
jgi:hypothetical protein